METPMHILAAQQRGRDSLPNAPDVVLDAMIEREIQQEAKFRRLLSGAQERLRLAQAERARRRGFQNGGDFS